MSPSIPLLLFGSRSDSTPVSLALYLPLQSTGLESSIKHLQCQAEREAEVDRGRSGETIHSGSRHERRRRSSHFLLQDPLLEPNSRTELLVDCWTERMMRETRETRPALNSPVLSCSPLPSVPATRVLGIPESYARRSVSMLLAFPRLSTLESRVHEDVVQLHSRSLAEQKGVLSRSRGCECES